MLTSNPNSTYSMVLFYLALPAASHARVDLIAPNDHSWEDSEGVITSRVKRDGISPAKDKGASNSRDPSPLPIARFLSKESWGLGGTRDMMVLECKNQAAREVTGTGDISNEPESPRLELSCLEEERRFLPFFMGKPSRGHVLGKEVATW
ncbi:hypothetical protein F5146DRAFT_1000241 [Armillaria mellea]|nr:hypothetical protein F5146DRAFT_1000241 [Armillaria mellea]